MRDCSRGTTLWKLPAASDLQCQKECMGVSKCKYWSWNSQSKVCHLKDHEAKIGAEYTTGKGIISGPKKCGNIRCRSIGDPHFFVYDGDNGQAFDFYDHGEFVLLKTANLEVHVRQQYDLLGMWSYAANTGVALRGL